MLNKTHHIILGACALTTILPVSIFAHAAAVAIAVATHVVWLIIDAHMTPGYYK